MTFLLDKHRSYKTTHILSARAWLYHFENIYYYDLVRTIVPYNCGNLPISFTIELID